MAYDDLIIGQADLGIPFKIDDPLSPNGNTDITQKEAWELPVCTSWYNGRLADWQIENLVKENGMIEPFVNEQVAADENGRKIISYGLSSYGYDIRLGNKFKVFNPRRGGLADPLALDTRKFLDDESGDYCDIAPGSYILGVTVERFKLPANMIVEVIGKSTYARLGLIINVTPGEPEWEGYLTLELCNGTPCPIRVYANMGIGQMKFEVGQKPRCTYKTRKTGVGKYQNQGAEPTDARLL